MVPQNTSEPIQASDRASRTFVALRRANSADHSVRAGDLSLGSPKHVPDATVAASNWH